MSRIRETDNKSILFLDKLNQLTLETNEVSRTFLRKKVPLADHTQNGFEVNILEKNVENGQRYWLWNKKIGGAENVSEKKEIKHSVADLPGKWPEVDEANVAIAVQVGYAVDTGMLNIYLPTQVLSGCAAHFSGPFYGDMSRTNIDFEHSFNQLLQNHLAELSVDIILESLVGHSNEEFAALLDLLSPVDSPEGQRWWNAVQQVLEGKEIDFESKNIALSDKGWSSFKFTKLTPPMKNLTVISEELYREEVTYPVFGHLTKERVQQIKQICEKIDINPSALPKDIANTIEPIAKRLHQEYGKIDWNGFWKDVELLLDRDGDPLNNKKVLLGTDDELHAVNDGSSVFFRPLVSGADDEVTETVDIREIPKNLRPYIAFLHESIVIHLSGEKGGVKTTPVHAFLNKLVQPYGVERIFSSVLVKAVPTLPAKHGSPEAELSRDILHWGLKLLSVSTGNREKPIDLLRKLPAPCRGGWFKLDDVSYGTGWPNKVGETLDIYLEKFDSTDSAGLRDRLLLPPSHADWGDLGISSLDVLDKAGVFDGLSLISVKNNEWESKFPIWGSVKLPSEGPPGFDKHFWESYRDYIKETEQPHYQGEFEYEVCDIYRVPGFTSWSSMDSGARKLLMELILVSASRWEAKWPDWKNTDIRKVDGHYNVFRPKSILHYILRTFDWLQATIDDKEICFGISDRWYIPNPSSIGGMHQFSHLRPIPKSIATILGRDDRIVEAMIKFGMPLYDQETQTESLKLLLDLASAWEDADTEVDNPNIFLGQVRTAWSQFSPGEDPREAGKLVVRQGTRMLDLNVVSPTDELPIYLPEASPDIHRGLELHLKPVVVIKTADAKRLRDYFSNVYGDRVRFASKLNQRALVNGEEWSEAGDEPLISEEIPWLIGVVLSAFAFAGSQSRGVGTKTFTRALDKLRKTRILWVDKLEVGLWHQDIEIATSSVDVLAPGESATIIACKEVMQDIGRLSDVLSAVVDREDLDTYLKLLLKGLEKDEKYSEEKFIISLRELHITPEEFEEVQRRCLGDFAWTLRLWRPLVLIFYPDFNLVELDSVTNTDELIGSLANAGVSEEKIESMSGLVTGASSFNSLGKDTWDNLGKGKKAERSKWNQALKLAGETTLKNESAEEQFREILETIRLTIRCLIRGVMIRNPNNSDFHKMDESIYNIECPTDLSEKLWVIGFETVMSAVAEKVHDWSIDPLLVEAIRSSTTCEQLSSRLSSLGVEINIDKDPIQIQSNNKGTLSKIIDRIQRIAIAWASKQEVKVDVWEQDRKKIEKMIFEDKMQAQFIDRWTEEDCLRLAYSLNQTKSKNSFWKALNSSISTNDVMELLDISERELGKADDTLAKLRITEDRKKEIVSVCGSEFQNTNDNLGNLWGHICDSIDKELVGSANLENFEELNSMKLGKNRKRGDNRNPVRKKKTAPGRMSQAMKNLVGFTGEIHAYRALQEQYGSDAVNSSSWVSDNSLYLYPENSTNDGYGCDFVVRFDEKTYYVEVKASQSDDEAFELGSTEVQLAIECANSRKKRFMILHVLNALSKEPALRVLPNPYDKKQTSKYRFEDVGLRVRYDASNL